MTDKLQDYPELISVIVPVYRAELSIARCIESIQAQTYENLQIILIDDGSPDNSGTICDDYAKDDARIVVLHTENAGVSSARNCGLSHAEGGYVAFVDSDDYITSTFIDDAYAQMKERRVDLYLAGLTMEINEAERHVRSEVYQAKQKTYSIRELLEAFNIDYPFLLICGPTCKLYRTDIIVDNRLRFDPDLSLGEDMLFNFDYYQHASNAYFSNNVFYHYIRGNEESLFSRYSPSLYEDTVKIYDRMRMLMMSVNCSKESIHRMEALYGRILISCIYHEYMFCNKSTPDSRKEVIRKVANNPYVRRYTFREGKNLKDFAVIALLKLRATKAVEKLFEAHYCKRN